MVFSPNKKASINVEAFFKLKHLNYCISPIFV